MAPSLMIKVFGNIVCLVLYKPFSVFFRIIIIIKGFKPPIECRVELILIGIGRIVENLTVPPVLKPDESEPGVISVFFIILV